MSDKKPDHDLADNGAAMDEPFFSVVLTPYRSLGTNGFLVLMLCLGATSFAAGMVFLSIGAWPVFGFFGLDMVLVWLAFRLNYASARQFEEVLIAPNEIIIRKVDPWRQELEYRFNPSWVRLAIDRDEEQGVTRISLSSRGETVDLGKFLNPEDRTSFASAIAHALATAKSGRVPC